MSFFSAGCTRTGEGFGGAHALRSPSICDWGGHLERALSTMEHDRIAEAMRSLPERSRLVLWYAEVEGMKPRDLGPVVGIAPNAASALLIRPAPD
jgi:DNA-directed RNA polymerase specialized sigma24 family protein